MKGESQAPPTHGLVYWLITHTHTSMYTNINIAMYTFTWDLWPAQAPVSGSGAYRGLAREGRNLEEGEVLLPSSHSTPKASCPFAAALAGQTPAAAGVQGISSDPPVWLSSQTLPRSPGLSLCVSRLPQGLEGGGCLRPGVSPGPSGFFPGFTGGWGCGAARRRRWCHWPALCPGRRPRRSPPRGSRAG